MSRKKKVSLPEEPRAASPHAKISMLVRNRKGSKNMETRGHLNFGSFEAFSLFVELD